MPNKASQKQVDKTEEDKRIQREAEEREAERQRDRVLRVTISERLLEKRTRNEGIVSNHRPAANTQLVGNEVLNQQRRDKEVERSGHEVAAQAGMNLDPRNVSDIHRERYIESQRQRREANHSHEQPKVETNLTRKFLRGVFDNNVVYGDIGISKPDHPMSDLLPSVQDQLRGLENRLSQLKANLSDNDTRTFAARNQFELLSKEINEKEAFIQNDNKEVKEAIQHSLLELKKQHKENDEMRRQVTGYYKKDGISMEEWTRLKEALEQGTAKLGGLVLSHKELQQREAAYLARKPFAMEELELLRTQCAEVHKKRAPLMAEYGADMTEAHHIQKQIIEYREYIDKAQSRIAETTSLPEEEKQQKRRVLNVDGAPAARRSRKRQQPPPMSDAAAGGWSRSSHDNDQIEVCGAPGGTFYVNGGPKDPLVEAAEGYDQGGVATPTTSDLDEEVVPTTSDLEDEVVPATNSGQKLLTPPPTSREHQDGEFDWDGVDFEGLGEVFQQSSPPPPAAASQDIPLGSMGMAVANAASPKPPDPVYTVGNGPPAPPSRW